MFLSYRCPYDFKSSCYEDFSLKLDFTEDRPTGVDRGTGKLIVKSRKIKGNYLDFFLGADFTLEVLRDFILSVSI